MSIKSSNNDSTDEAKDNIISLRKIQVGKALAIVGDSSIDKR